MPLPKGLKTIGFVAGLSAATAGTTGGCDNHILPPEAPKPVVATVSNSKSGPYFIMCLPDDPSFTYRSDRRRNVVKKLFTTRQYKTFDDFYRVLALTNNINTANFHGPAGIGEGLTDEDSHNHKMNGFEKRSFVVQLLKRANLTGKFIASAPDGIQDNIKAMDGKIVIWAHTKTSDDSELGCTYYAPTLIYVIDSDFNVSKKFINTNLVTCDKSKEFIEK